MNILTIIVTYNAMTWVDRCLGNLRQSKVPTDIFVVDNGSVDGTQDYILRNYPEVRFVQNTENTGFGAANNIGMRYAVDNNYKYVYLLNQDAWIAPDTFGKLIEVAESNPDYGVLSPKQMQADMLAMDRNFKKGPYSQNPKVHCDAETNNVQDVYEVETVMAAHWLMPVSTIKEVGLFSPSFRHYGEDDNYTARLRYHGLKAGIVLSVLAVHDRQYRVESKQKLLYQHKVNMLKLFSDPSLSIGRSFYRLAGDSLKAVIRLKSLSPIINAAGLLLQWRDIRRNRTVSMEQKGAFL